jgi:hypothetical protein
MNGTELLRLTTDRFATAEKNVAACCELKCDQPCLECLIVEVNRLRDLEQSQSATSQNAA